MNTLFIIGNCFDINLGLHTKYQNFYKFYQEIKTTSTTINNLKSSISDNWENWADLELELGNYTAKINSLDEFDTIYEDIVEQLATYLEEEENKFDFTSIKQEQFFLDLIAPERFLLPADKDEVNLFKAAWEGSHWLINLMTLNYTRTIEKILGDNSPNKKIGTHHGRYDVYLQSLEHIHGYLDNRMILGVNDISQIKNTNLHTVEDIRDTIIKSNYNKIAKQIVHERCEQLVKNANLICIFGSSIGDTDKLWWELIGQRLKENCKLIIFRRGNKLNNRFQHKLARHERESKEYFLNKTNLTEQEKKQVRNNIYMAINSDIFTNLKS